MAMLATRWVALGDFWVMLRHISGKMASKSARMSQHMRQGANPRGFEVSAKTQDGREASFGYARSAQQLGGVAR